MGLAVLSSACAAPGFVEGIVDEQGFTIRDESPDLRRQHDDAALIVLAQKDWGALRVVSLRIPAISELAAEEELSLGTRADDGAWVEVAQGPIDESLRSDGVTVLNTLQPRFVNGTGGTVSLTQEDGVLYGTLAAELEDGGWLDGSFVVALDDL